MKYIFIGFGAMLMLFTSTVKAQNDNTPWSIEKCISYAIENNITIKQQSLNVNYSENQLKQSKFDRAPNLNAGLGHQFQFGRSLNYDNTYANANSQNSDLTIQSEVTLYNGLTKLNTIKQRDFESRAALKDLEKAKNDITIGVASAYLEILFNQELVNTSLEQIRVTNIQIDFNKKQVEAGNMPRGQLLETEAQLANEELNLTTYENQLQLSKLNLMQLLELPIRDSFEVVVPAFDSNLLDVRLVTPNDVFAKAVAERPEILSQELTLQSIEKQTEIAKAQRLPNLSMGARYGTNYNNKYQRPIDATDPTLGYENIPFGDQINNQRQTSVYLSLNIPIFNRLSTKTQIDNSYLNYESNKHELQKVKNTLQKEIQQVHLNALASMKSYYSSEKAVTSTEEAFRYVEEKFSLGLVTPLEYNDAKNRVTNAQSSFIQAKYEYIFRVKILDFYTGKEITL